MCDGYIPFARAFVRGDIDTTGFEVAYSAVENAPEDAFTARTPPTQGRTRGKRRLARIREFLGLRRR